MSFLNEKCPIPQNDLQRLGRHMRNGEPYDQELFDKFMIHHTAIIEEVQPILLDAFDTFHFRKASDEEDITPYSARYRFSARPKMKKTVIEKLRRMKTTPIHRIQDIAGLRFDFDSNLTMQLNTAHHLNDHLTQAGATRVDVKDLRTSPHSGYRAVHIHANFNAGRIEVQLRTALQAQWANIYEVAADVLGREIRYQESFEETDSSTRSLLDKLHSLSDGIYSIEKERDELGGRHSNAPEDRDRDLKIEKLREKTLTIYDNMEEIVQMFTAIRDHEPWEHLANESKER